MSKHRIGNEKDGYKDIPFTDEENATQNVLEAAHLADLPKQQAHANIQALETMPRRVREALLALGTEDQVIRDEDAAIVSERSKL